MQTIINNINSNLKIRLERSSEEDKEEKSMWKNYYIVPKVTII